MTAKRLILLNVIVYVALKMLWLASSAWGWDFPRVVDALALPSQPAILMTKPWTLITYMFTQLDFWHLLVNMLWLGWFGTLFREGNAPGRLATVYIFGGMAGAVCFIATSTLAATPDATAASATLVGASAATLAVVAATTFRTPNLPVRLLFFFEARLKWLAPISHLPLVLPPESCNTPCFAAHLGGVAAGILAGYACHRAHYRRLRETMEANAYGSRLLDKARKNGFNSLTAEERRLLFDTTGGNHKGAQKS